MAAIQVAVEERASAPTCSSGTVDENLTQIASDDLGYIRPPAWSTALALRPCRPFEGILSSTKASTIDLGSVSTKDGNLRLLTRKIASLESARIAPRDMPGRESALFAAS